MDNEKTLNNKIDYWKKHQSISTKEKRRRRNNNRNQNI